MTVDIPALRLHNQHIARPSRRTPEELVAHLGAVQAQEYPFAKWALGLRLGGNVVDQDIERALVEGTILRTHVLRPTWHFVTAQDIRWMLELTGPRVEVAIRSFRRHNELDQKLLKRAASVIERALADRTYLTRRELAQRLERERMVLTPSQLAGVAMYAELNGIICSGPRRGKLATYGLLSERAPTGRDLRGDEALAELTTRFFRSHGPASVRDFVWWSGLKASDARRGLDIITARHFEQDGVTYWTTGRTKSAAAAPGVHLLPIYDEYLVAYRDRIAVPHGPPTIGRGRTGVTFQHALVIQGHVAGTWRVEHQRQSTVLNVTPLRRLTPAERAGINKAAARYGRFLSSRDLVIELSRYRRRSGSTAR